MRSLKPGELLDEELTNRRLSVRQVADNWGLSKQTIYNGLKGQIGKKLAEKISKDFGNTRDFWMREVVYVSEKVGEKVQNYVDGELEPQKGSENFLLTDSSLLHAIKNDLISMTNFKEENLRSASYDLTVGEVIKMDGTEADLSHDYELKKGEAAHITTAEEITLPKNYFARVGGIAENARKWLFSSVGLQVDPQFSGKLAFSVMYNGPDFFTLWRGQRILSIEIYRISPAPLKGFEDYDEAGEIQEVLARLYEKSISGLFKISKTSDGENFVELQDTSVAAKAENGETHEDLIEACVEQFHRQLADKNKIILHHVGAIMKQITLKKREIRQLLDLLEISFHEEDQEILKSDGTTSSFYMPEDGKAQPLSSIAINLGIEQLDFLMALSGLTSWISLKSG